MKKLLGVVVGLIAVLAVAVGVLPGLIDWNDYKDPIQAQIKALTGRDVVIGGDIRIAVLPAPAVVANGVRMANIDGASAADMVRLKSVEVRVALGPLLTGNVQVETVKLVDPIVELERLADGRANWEFAPVRAETDGSKSAALPGVGGGESGTAAAIRLDNFHVENGTVIYRDARSGTIERIERVEARLSAESLSGPFDSMGNLDFRGIPLGYEVSVGRVINERTVPVNMVLTVEPEIAKVDIAGAVVEMTEAPKFKGKVVASGKTLSDLLSALDGGTASPALFAQPFGVSGDVTVSAADLAVKKLAVSLGGLRADGELAANLAETPVGFSTRLTLPKVDLDALLAASRDGPAAASGGQAPAAATTGEVAKPDAPPHVGGGFELPEVVNGSIEVTAETVAYRGNIVSDARAVAELRGGEVTLSQFTAQLPGGSDLFLTGFLTAQDGQPKFDGTVDARISDLRRVVAWLGGEVPAIASDRLRNATVKGRIVADPQQVQGLNLDMVVDSSHITGGVTVALRRRPAFGASFVIDRLNLDGYLPADGAPAAGAAASARPEPEPQSSGATAAARPEAGFALPGFLSRFDANLRLQVERMTYRQIPVSGLIFDAMLFAGSLEMRRVAVGDLAGASASLSGTLGGLNAVPSLKSVRFEARGIDVDRLSRLLEIPAPVSTRDLGVVEVSGVVEGSLLRPQVDLAARTPEAAVDLRGRLSMLPVAALFDGDVKVRHAEFPRLLRLFGVDYRPAGRLGDFGLSATVKADVETIALSQLEGTVGTATVAGALSVDLAGSRPRLAGELKAGRIVVDSFLPARRSAALPDGSGGTVSGARVVPAAWMPAQAAGGGAPRVWLAAASAGGRWPTEPIDLAVLGTFDADLKLAGEAFVYEGVNLRDVAADATVAEGVLRIASLTGTLFGGALAGEATLASAPKPAIDGALSLTGGDFGMLEQELRGKRLATGDVGFRTTVKATGASVAELVSGLKGEGAFEMNKVALTEESGKSPLGPVSGLLSGLNQLAGLGGGGRRPEGLADISGTFTIDRGIARSEDFRFVSNIGEGQAKGHVDLPKWTMKVEGDIRLSQNLFSQLLSGTTGLNLTLPFRIEGDVDEPTVVLDVAKLPGKALGIPGTLLDKSGVGKVLRRLIPGTAN